MHGASDRGLALQRPSSVHAFERSQSESLITRHSPSEKLQRPTFSHPSNKRQSSSSASTHVPLTGEQWPSDLQGEALVQSVSVIAAHASPCLLHRPELRHAALVAECRTATVPCARGKLATAVVRWDTVSAA